MVNGYDIAYGLGLALASPYWLIHSKARRKVFKAFSERMGRVEPRRDPTRPAVMIHAVSLGEMNATRAMVGKLRDARPELQFIISTTTDTGFEQGRKLYGDATDCQVIRFPLDFTDAIDRTLDAMKPSAVVLMELEVWPNFLAQCERRDIPVLLVNGRLTASSFRTYRLAGPVTETMFRRLALTCAQDQTYADRFIALGAPRERVRVTGTMKFDNAEVADRIEGADVLAESLGLRTLEKEIKPGGQVHADVLAESLGLRTGIERIWVCGSTGPGEEPIVLDAYRELRRRHPDLRLAIIPRHPQRFDEVARLIESAGFDLVRRSSTQDSARSTQHSPVILGDTMGELRKFYSLADVVFVGRSIVDLGPRQHGSDMIEPAALAKPVIVGPFTGNFAEVMNAFRLSSAMAEIQTADELAGAIERMLTGAADSKAMGLRAQEVVRREQGATRRHVEVILERLPSSRT